MATETEARSTPISFETHPDLVLLQTSPGRLVPHLLMIGAREGRGTRRIAASGGTWLLDRSSRFPAAADAPSVRIPAD